MGRDRIRGIREAYRTLFAPGVKLEDALARLDTLGANGNPAGAEYAAFVRASERGVARPARRG